MRWRNLVSIALAVLAAACSGYHPVGITNPTTGYSIEVSTGGDEFVPVTIDAEGEGCERFSADEGAERTCLIARLLNPWTIGGEAYGELNDRQTPALDALVWRARADADASVCARGGLSGPFLQECERDAIADDYEYAIGNFRVRVLIGGAQPSPSP